MIRSPSGATRQSSPRAGRNVGTPRRSPSWRAAKGSDSRDRPTGPDHRSLPGLSIGNMGFLYAEAIGGLRDPAPAVATLPR